MDNSKIKTDKVNSMKTVPDSGKQIGVPSVPARQPINTGYINQDQIVPGLIKQRHLAATPVIANGDLYYGDGNNNFIRIPIGTTNQTLKVINGIPTWA